jgi:hypothetical protein
MKLTRSSRIELHATAWALRASIRRESDPRPWKSLSGATRFTGEGDDKPGAATYGRPYVGFEPSGKE